MGRESTELGEFEVVGDIQNQEILSETSSTELPQPRPSLNGLFWLGNSGNTPQRDMPPLEGFLCTGLCAQPFSEEKNYQVDELITYEQSLTDLLKKKLELLKYIHEKIYNSKVMGKVMGDEDFSYFVRQLIEFDKGTNFNRTNTIDNLKNQIKIITNGENSAGLLKNQQFQKVHKARLKLQKKVKRKIYNLSDKWSVILIEENRIKAIEYAKKLFDLRKQFITLKYKVELDKALLESTDNDDGAKLQDLTKEIGLGHKELEDIKIELKKEEEKFLLRLLNRKQKMENRHKKRESVEAVISRLGLRLEASVHNQSQNRKKLEYNEKMFAIEISKFEQDKMTTHLEKLDKAIKELTQQQESMSQKENLSKSIDDLSSRIVQSVLADESEKDTCAINLGRSGEKNINEKHPDILARSRVPESLEVIEEITDETTPIPANLIIDNQESPMSKEIVGAEEKRVIEPLSKSKKIGIHQLLAKSRYRITLGKDFQIDKGFNPAIVEILEKILTYKVQQKGQSKIEVGYINVIAYLILSFPDLKNVAYENGFMKLNYYDFKDSILINEGYNGLNIYRRLSKEEFDHMVDQANFSLVVEANKDTNGKYIKKMAGDIPVRYGLTKRKKMLIGGLIVAGCLTLAILSGGLVFLAIWTLAVLGPCFAIPKSRYGWNDSKCKEMNEFNEYFDQFFKGKWEEIFIENELIQMQNKLKKLSRDIERPDAIKNESYKWVVEQILRNVNDEIQFLFNTLDDDAEYESKGHNIPRIQMLKSIKDSILDLSKKIVIAKQCNYENIEIPSRENISEFKKSQTLLV